MGGKHSRNRKNRPLVIVLSLAMIFSAMTAFWSFGEGTESSGGSTPTVTSSSGTGTGTQTGSTDSTGSDNGSGSTGTKESSASVSSVSGTGDTQAQSDAGSEGNKEIKSDTAGTNNTNGMKIDYDEKTDIHSLDNGNIILYCMNNRMHWPHDTPSFTAPNYTEGYLTQENFNSSQYNEFISKLTTILYAGYPYNGLGMYQIADDNNITEEQFNKALEPTAALRKAFSDTLGNETFSYSDWKNLNQDHLQRLESFLKEVGALFPSGSTSNGLTYSQITASPFYKAALCIYYSIDSNTHEHNNSDPISQYNNLYSGEYFVSEKKAYENTSYAVWYLMKEYGVANNDITDLSAYPLAKRLVDESGNTNILTSQPSSDQVNVTGDTRFTYNADDGYWYSGTLQVTEPDNYRGQYKLTLPSGYSVVDGGDTVTSGQGFQLKADHQPSETEKISLEASNLVWIESVKQYSPVKNADGTEKTDSEGKGFQSMVGAVIHKATISKTFNPSAKVGNLKITKTVNGNDSATKKFNFQVTLTDEDGNPASKLSGTYGDVSFKDGISESIALGNGDSKEITGLPAGLAYKVTEDGDTDYTSSSTGNTGTITAGGTSVANFTNTYKTDTRSLTITKKVVGSDDSQVGPFSIKVMLSDKDGKPMKNPLNYIGSESEKKSASMNSDASVNLSLYNQGSVTFTGLPENTSYSVEEGSHPGYSVSYSPAQKGTFSSKNEKKNLEITNTPEKPDTPAVPDVPSVTVTPASADLRVQKLIIGNDGKWPEGASFTMNLQAKDNAPMPKNGTVNGVKSITVSSESPASFGTIRYEKAGTYHYIVTESKGSDKNFTYDETQHPVTVTVTESADHKLTASISGGNSSGIVEISNHYTKPKEENGGKEENSGGNKTNGSTNNSSGKNSSEGSKTNGSTSSKTNGQVQPANTKTLKNSLAKTNPSGSAASSGNASGSLVRTGDQTNLAVMIALLLTSACGLAAVLALKKKRRDDRASEGRQ